MLEGKSINCFFESGHNGQGDLIESWRRGRELRLLKRSSFFRAVAERDSLNTTAVGISEPAFLEDSMFHAHSRTKHIVQKYSPINVIIALNFI